jgi:2-iminobutanoate/2-iminopropanoate deaminase
MSHDVAPFLLTKTCVNRGAATAIANGRHGRTARRSRRLSMTAEIAAGPHQRLGDRNRAVAKLWPAFASQAEYPDGRRWGYAKLPRQTPVLSASRNRYRPLHQRIRACAMNEKTMTDITRTGYIDGVPVPTGPWKWTVAWNGLVFVSGVRGIELSTGRPADGDERRIALIFEHLGHILREAGSSFDSVLSSTVYVTDMVRLRPMVNDAYVKAFGTNLPTRTIVEVAGLNQNDSIEIEVVAVTRSPPPAGRRGSRNRG